MRKTKIAILFIVLLLTAYIVNASTIYIKPNDINFEKVLLGGYAEKTITITTDSQDFLFITPSVGGTNKDWIRLSPNTSLKVSEELPLQLKVAVKPPKNAGTGKYSGYLLLNIVNKEIPQISVDRETSIILKTMVETTDKEIKKLEIKDISVSSTEQDHPIDFFITTLNQGNVETRLIVKIKLGNRLHVAETTVFPFEEKEIFINLDSKGLELGRHLAAISILLDDVLIKEETFAFNILKKGSLIRKGVLLDIANKERAHIGDRITIDSYFRNIGEISVYPKFKGMIYFNDSLVKEIESKQLYVPTDKTTILSSYFTPTEIGTYYITGQVLYSNTITDEKSSFVDVKSQSESLDVLALGINPLVLVFLTLLLVFFTHIYLRKKVPVEK